MFVGVVKLLFSIVQPVGLLVITSLKSNVAGKPMAGSKHKSKEAKGIPLEVLLEHSGSISKVWYEDTSEQAGLEILYSNLKNPPSTKPGNSMFKE